MPRKKTKEEFIEQAENKHGDKYNYDKVVYIDSKIKVIIYCNTCEENFSQVPSKHIFGQGCPNCAGHRKKTKEEFIEQAENKHGDKYNYNKVVYINSKTKVILYCNICKQNFEQRPSDHLQKHGCPNCKFKTEQKSREITEDITGLKFPKTRPQFLKSEKYPTGLELDCYNEQYQIAIEVDGIQHFQFHTYFHNTVDDFKYQQIRDNDKNTLCEENKVHLIRINHTFTYRDTKKIYDFLVNEFEK